MSYLRILSLFLSIRPYSFSLVEGTFHLTISDEFSFLNPGLFWFLPQPSIDEVQLPDDLF